MIRREPGHIGVQLASHCGAPLARQYSKRIRVSMELERADGWEARQGAHALSDFVYGASLGAYSKSAARDETAFL